jgi:hypothetical protein
MEKVLTVGRPVNIYADIPILPPFAAAICALFAFFLWWATGWRLSFLPPMCVSCVLRGALLIAFAAIIYIINICGMKKLEESGYFSPYPTLIHTYSTNSYKSENRSGENFVPVGGLACTGIYQYTRNPLYCGLLFVALPGAAVVLDSAWLLVGMVPLFLYLNQVVIAAEEKFLADTFGDDYTEFCNNVPRWLLI